MYNYFMLVFFFFDWKYSPRLLRSMGVKMYINIVYEYIHKLPTSIEKMNIFDE